jgi:hypothetical protein
MQRFSILIVSADERTLADLNPDYPPKETKVGEIRAINERVAYREACKMFPDECCIDINVVWLADEVLQ